MVIPRALWYLICTIRCVNLQLYCFQYLAEKGYHVRQRVLIYIRQHGYFAQARFLYTQLIRSLHILNMSCQEYTCQDSCCVLEAMSIDNHHRYLPSFLLLLTLSTQATPSNLVYNLVYYTDTPRIEYPVYIQSHVIIVRVRSRARVESTRDYYIIITFFRI